MAVDVREKPVEAAGYALDVEAHGFAEWEVLLCSSDRIGSDLLMVSVSLEASPASGVAATAIVRNRDE